MTKRNALLSIIILFAMSVLIACGNSTETEGVPAVTRTQFEEPPVNVRDYRYCEIIPIFREGTTIVAEVYNTFGLNDCPTDLWNALDGDALAESYGAMDIRMNGPRFWVIDELIGEEAAADGKVADFGGIEMILPGRVETKLREGSVGSEFYTENEVERFTTYTFYAGELVYELVSPEGDVYRMQSYAQLVDENLTIDDLETLGDRLDLPEGWLYQASVLTDEEKLIADGLAFVINDTLGSSYQKVLDE